MVEQDRPGLGIAPPHLLVAEQQVEIVVGLGPRVDGVRRGAPHRGDHDVDAVAEIVRARLQRQRRAFDDQGRPGRLIDVAARHVGAARHALGDPVVLVLVEQVQVPLQHVFGDLGELFVRHADVELEVAHGLVEAVEMLVELEDAMAEGPRRVEAAIAIAEAAIAERHDGAALRHDLPVHVDDALVGPLHDLLSWPEGGQFTRCARMKSRSTSTPIPGPCGIATVPSSARWNRVSVMPRVSALWLTLNSTKRARGSVAMSCRL